MHNPGQPRIAIDCSPLRYPNTGLGQFILLLVRAMDAEKPSADITYLVHAASRSLLPPVDSRHVVYLNWFRRHLPAWILPAQFPRYDLWHISSEMSRISRFPKSSRVLVTLHGLHFLDEDPPELAARKLKEVQQLIDRADGIATVSAFTEALVRKHLELRGQPIRVIPHGVEDAPGNDQRPGAGLPHGKFLFSIGTFFERKNFHVLLAFLQQLDGYSLVLAGNSRTVYGDFIREEINRLSLSDRVFLPGEVNDAEKRWLYRHCEAFVFPSLSEGFGIPVIEAMKAGKPVFCSTRGSLPEVGGEEAFYWHEFAPGEMKDVFMEGISKFRSQPEKEQNCRRRADSYTWKRAAQSYLAFYSELLR